MNIPWENFDLSALTYPQFLAFFFDRPVVSGRESYDLFRSGIDGFDASNPAALVVYIKQMCRNYSELARAHSSGQLDQGLGAIFGAGISCERYLFDGSVEIRLRVECVESMYLPFRNVVASKAGDIKDSFYWMWWDMILHTFELMPNEYKHGYVTLTTDQEQMIDTIYQTLAKILAIDHRGCQRSALHGMGHLYHPLKEELVQRYLDEHRTELNAEDLQ